MKRIIFAASCAALVTVVSCSHKSTQTEPPREPATTEKRESHISPERMEKLRAAVAQMDAAVIQDNLNGARMSQILVSSFDARLAKLSKEEDVDKLMTSTLYCKLMAARPIQEAIDDRLGFIFETALKSGPDAKAWFLRELNAFAQKDAMNEIAAIQVVRSLVADEVSYCGDKGCVARDVATLSFRVAPLDDEAFAEFTRRNQIVYDKISKTDLRPGLCFGDQRKPNSASSYDWTNRNWVGSVLPQGSFVFTYDDGPHKDYTRVIRDTWANGGLAKPAFFWLAGNVQRLSGIATELNKQGYVIGSHSERHADLGNVARAGSVGDLNKVNRQLFASELSGLSAAGFSDWKNKTLDREINQSVATLGNILGKPVRYFRLPYGSGTKNDLIGARFEKLNLDHFFWRIDSLDWQDKNPASIRDRVVSQMKATGRGIVLFHDIHSQSAQAAQLMVNYLKANPNYKAVNILDLPGLQK
jgi:peptidoglycan/xylan/chitin deacetylase (PgdA/CDA1 family)